MAVVSACWCAGLSVTAVTVLSQPRLPSDSRFPSRDNLQTRSERRLQRQSPLWDRNFIRGPDLLHDALNKEVKDLQLAVEDLDELLIGFNAHDDLWEYVVPAQDIDPASLGNIELTLQLRPEAFVELSGNPVFDLGVRQRG